MEPSTYLASVLVLILAAGTVGAIVGVILADLVTPPSLRHRPTVLVVLKDGETIRGALLHRRRSTLELGSAEVLGRETNTRIDGVVHLDRANVAWVQRPGA